MGGKSKPDLLPTSSKEVLLNVCSLHPPCHCPSKTLLSCEINVFDLREEVEKFVLAFAVGFGRDVGSVQMNGVSFFFFFFFSRFRELAVRDGEMSPLSFQANQMIILTGNFLFLFSISLNT